MNTTLTLLGKEFTLFLKDKTAILLTFLVPFFVIYIVGNIFSGSGDGGGLSSNIKLAVYNASGDPAAENLVRALEAEEGLDVILGTAGENDSTVPFTLESVRLGIENHDYNFALIIPENYIKEDEFGLRLQFLSNPKNQIESQIVNGLIQKTLFTKLPQLLSGELDRYQAEFMGEEKYNAFLDGLASLIALSYEDVEYEEVRDRVSLKGLADFLTSSTETSAGDGEADEGASDLLGNLLEIEEDQVFGKEVKNPYLTRMVGGYAIMFLLFATTGSATSLFEERNEGIFLRLLSMPVKRTHILWSKFLFNTLLGIVQANVLFIASSFLFDVGVFDNFLNLFIVSAFAAAACTAFGMLLASVSKTPQQASGFGTLLIISMSAMGGAWFPLNWMPEPMQILGKFTLVYWGVEAYLAALWEDASIAGILPYLGAIGAITVVLMAIATWRFKVGNLFR